MPKSKKRNSSIKKKSLKLILKKGSTKSLKKRTPYLYMSFMDGKEKGAHEWMIEFKKNPTDIDQFRSILDETLQSLNSDYEAKRYNNMTLNPLVINLARPQLFYDWLKERDKLGGQHKIPRLSNQREYLEQLKGLQ